MQEILATANALIISAAAVSIDASALLERRVMVTLASEGRVPATARASLSRVKKGAR
ncbi:MAG: hypothetical protein U0441_00960 [Polyangiaceae bacterium]